MILDSLQGLQDETAGYKPGSIHIVKRAAHMAQQYVKHSGDGGKKRVAICIGQINKDGAVAGPEMLQHLCDTLLMMQGSSEPHGGNNHESLQRHHGTDHLQDDADGIVLRGCPHGAT
jgi:predicted ATP-dependent serine protease